MQYHRKLRPFRPHLPKCRVGRLKKRPALPPGPARCPRRALPAIRPRAGLHPKKGGSDCEPWRGRLQPSRRAERAFFMGMEQGLYALDLRPWHPQARRRRERVAGDDNNAWGRQGREDGAYPPLPHAPREPRRNEQGPGNLLPRPSGWSPRRRSYLSFHDCAAWSRRVGPQALPSAPCLQQLRLAPSSATGGGQLRCVASTLCWLTSME